MNANKYRLTLRKSAVHTDSNHEVGIDIFCLQDIKKAISWPFSHWKHYLYLGPYKVGCVEFYAENYFKFTSIFGVVSYNDIHGSGFIMDYECLEKLIDKDISIEQFIEETISIHYQVEIAETAEKAWQLLQDDWRCICNLKRFINPKFLDGDFFEEEKRLIFIKR